MRFTLVALLMLAACSGGTPDDDVDPAVQQSVVDRIEALTDCEDLQAEFDQAAANNDIAEPQTPAFNASLAYMQVADATMRAVGCY